MHTINRKTVLVACEFSGIVRDSFIRKGFDAWSCDLLDTEKPGPHIKADVTELLREVPNWDLIITHPPCTHLAISGSRWFKYKEQEQKEALKFVEFFLSFPVKCLALENPVSVISTYIRPPDQTIQPWQFGHGETKRTCLWLKYLPHLKPTNIVNGRKHLIHTEPPGPNQWKNRSRTYKGIAEAMADQWGDWINRL